MARAALKPLSNLDQIFDLRVCINFLFAAQLTCFKRLSNAHVAATDRRRNELRYPVNLRVRDIERATYVLDCCS